MFLLHFYRDAIFLKAEICKVCPSIALFCCCFELPSIIGLLNFSVKCQLLHMTISYCKFNFSSFRTAYCICFMIFSSNKIRFSNLRSVLPSLFVTYLSKHIPVLFTLFLPLFFGRFFFKTSLFQLLSASAIGFRMSPCLDFLHILLYPVISGELILPHHFLTLLPSREELQKF